MAEGVPAAGKNASTDKPDKPDKPAFPSTKVLFIVGTPITAVTGAVLGTYVGDYLDQPGEVGTFGFGAFCLAWGILCGLWAKERV